MVAAVRTVAGQRLWRGYLVNDMRALDPLRVPVKGIQLIEASAGTGKTWTLAALYVRLVLGHGGLPALLPAQILVVTFTRAATAELRERIRERLATAAAAFRHRAEPDDFLNALIADYTSDEQRAYAARQLDLAAQWMDEAAIFTIHGWCQRMLTQHAFLGDDASNAVADDHARLNEAVLDYWRCFYAPMNEREAACVAKQWSTPEQLQRALQPLIHRPIEQLRVNGQSLSIVEDLLRALVIRETPRRNAERTARTALADDFSVVEALIRSAAQSGSLNRNSYKLANLERDIAALRAWTDGDDSCFEFVERYAQNRLDKARNKNGASLTHAAFSAIQSVVAAVENEQPLAPLLLAHAVPWINRRLDEIRERQATLAYDDMLRQFDAALTSAHGASLSQIIAEQYPAALVDEFQDTDPLQWRIFQRIYDQRINTALVLIGDPKQSIYAFRGADVSTYLSARDKAQSPTWTLLDNYRSTPALVSAVNQLFTHADQHPQGAFSTGNDGRRLLFQPVQARKPTGTLEIDHAAISALNVTVLSDTETLNGGRYLDQSASLTADTITRYLIKAEHGAATLPASNGENRTLRPSDIAILVRDRYEADCMRRALRLRHIASVFVSERDSVYASREAADMLLWLQACANPGSDRAMRAALATITMARSLIELDQLNHDENAWEQNDERIQALRRVWQSHGVLAMLHNWIHTFDLPARLLSHAQGERTLTNLQHLAELLQHAAAALDGEHALLRYLASQITQATATGASLSDDQILRLESEEDLVRIVTIHKSKGLQYPIVMLPFPCRTRKENAQAIQVSHDSSGKALIELNPDDDVSKQIGHERLQEDLRLLYVALTRAEYTCFINAACVTSGQSKASALHRTAFGYLLSGGAPIEPSNLMKQLLSLKGGDENIHVTLVGENHPIQVFHPAKPQSLRRQSRISHLRPPEPWWIASYSALIHGATESTQIIAPETATQDILSEAAREMNDAAMIERRGTIHAFPRGAEPGTFLHDLLEWIAEFGFLNGIAQSDALEKQIARRCERRGWQMWILPLTQWMKGLLKTPLALPDNGSLTLAELTDRSRYHAEMEFWFEAHGVDTLQLDRLVTLHTLNGAPRPALAYHHVNGMLKGFIDLIVEKAGRYYIIDYKSNWLGENTYAYTDEAMRDAALHSRYDLQYAIYTLALHRHLSARLPGYRYDQHVGGVMYLYLRGIDENGHGVHAQRLPFALIDQMDRLFAAGANADAA